MDFSSNSVRELVIRLSKYQLFKFDYEYVLSVYDLGFTGTYLIIQTVDLVMIWGDLPMMTGVAFLLFTNLAQAAKIFFTIRRRRLVQSIIKGADEALRAVETDEARAIVKRCLAMVLYNLSIDFYFTDPVCNFADILS